MTFEDIKKLDDEYVMHTYGRYQLAIDHGKSATCYAPTARHTSTSPAASA